MFSNEAIATVAYAAVTAGQGSQFDELADVKRVEFIEAVHMVRLGVVQETGIDAVFDAVVRTMLALDDGGDAQAASDAAVQELRAQALSGALGLAKVQNEPTADGVIVDADKFTRFILSGAPAAEADAG